MIVAVARRTGTELLFDVLARLFNACLGGVLGLSCGVQHRRRLIIDDLLPADRPTALATIICAGALIGLIWGKKIWAVIDRRFSAGWGSKPNVRSDDVGHDERQRRKRDR
jgi:hypothetical protein